MAGLLGDCCGTEHYIYYTALPTHESKSPGSGLKKSFSHALRLHGPGTFGTNPGPPTFLLVSQSVEPMKTWGKHSLHTQTLFKIWSLTRGGHPLPELSLLPLMPSLVSCHFHFFQRQHTDRVYDPTVLDGTEVSPFPHGDPHFPQWSSHQHLSHPQRSPSTHTHKTP